MSVLSKLNVSPNRRPPSDPRPTAHSLEIFRAGPRPHRRWTATLGGFPYARDLPVLFDDPDLVDLRDQAHADPESPVHAIPDEEDPPDGF